MYVKKLTIDRFRHLRDVQLGPFPEPGQTGDSIALVGSNGGGKSSVLEALDYLIAAPMAKDHWRWREIQGLRASIEFGWSTEEVENLRSLEPATTDEREVREYFADSKTATAGRSGSDNAVSTSFLITVGSMLQRTSTPPAGFLLRPDRRYPTRILDQGAVSKFNKTRRTEHAARYAFRPPDEQYADIYDYLAQLSYHHDTALGHWEKRRRSGETVGAEPPDPISPYNSLLDRILPAYRFANPSAEVPTRLFIELPTAEYIPFEDLSSGEQEVILLLAYFIRYNVRRAVVLLDEPELHLHPNLSRSLVREMQAISGGSQLWIGSHNAEIIDETGRDRTFYLARGADHTATARSAAEGNDLVRESLQAFFGGAGYLGVGRPILFLEGEASSLDRKVFAKMFPKTSSQFRIVPSGGVDSQTRINAAVLALLEAEVGQMKYYLLRDRDYMPDETVDAWKAKSAGRVHVLERNQIENYLLDFESIAHVMSEIYEMEGTPDSWRDRFKSIATANSGLVASQLVTHRLNLLLAPQDFSQGQFMAGQPLVTASGVVADRVAGITGRFVRAAVAINGQISSELESQIIEQKVKGWIDLVIDSLWEGSDKWLSLFPGKRLISEFARRTSGIGGEISFTNNLIRAMSDLERVPSELVQVASAVAAGTDLDAPAEPSARPQVQ